jgi:hypothetical protein
VTNWKYVAGLLLIILIVWFTMILCFSIIYSLLPPLDQLLSGGPTRLVINIIQLLAAGAILIAWLYGWNMLTKFYFLRNLNPSEPKSSGATRKRGKRD